MDLMFADTADWQDWTVRIIGIAVAAWLVVRAAGLFGRRRRRSCAGCDATDCPLRKQVRSGKSRGRGPAA